MSMLSRTSSKLNVELNDRLNRFTKHVVDIILKLLVMGPSEDPDNLSGGFLAAGGGLLQRRLLETYTKLNLGWLPGTVL